MSQASELLNSLTETTPEDVVTGSNIVIGRDRFLVVPESLKKLGVQFDHDVETVTFDCPRFWDEWDLSRMKIYVNYMRSDSGMGTCLCKNVTVDPIDSEMVHFEWTVSGNVTVVEGGLSVLVCAKSVESDGTEKTHWNSELNTDMYISKGLRCADTILRRYPDIITQLLLRMEHAEAEVTRDAIRTRINECLATEATTQATIHAVAKAYLEEDIALEEVVHDTVDQYLTENPVEEIQGALAMQTLGYAKLNLWDEEWESGYFDISTGNLLVNDTLSRSKNYILVKPDTKYYMYNGSWGEARIGFFDSEFKALGGVNAKTFTTPSNCQYIKFYWLGTTYNNDICINLFDPNINGQYYPYVPSVDERFKSLPEPVKLSEPVANSDVAYVKDVPADIAAYAKLNMLGGMTRKCTNLCKGISNQNNTTVVDGVATQTEADIKTTFNAKAVPYANGEVESDGVGTASVALGVVSIVFKKTNATVLRFGVNGSNFDTLIRTDISHLPAGTYIISANFTNITQGSISWKDVTINSGDTALPYEPYFSGLRSAPVSEVESVGINLVGFDDCDLPNTNANVKIENNVFTRSANVHFTSTYVISIQAMPYMHPVILLPDTYTFSIDILELVGTAGPKQCYAEVTLEDGTVEKLYAGVPKELSQRGTITNFCSESYGVNAGGYYTCRVQIVRGSEVLPYAHYIKHTIPVPEAVQALDGYGEGINESVYNYVDWEKKQFVKRVGCVDMGTLNWKYAANETMFWASVDGLSTGNKVMCAPYTSNLSWDEFVSGDKCVKANYTYAANAINIRDSAYTDAASFKAAMSGVMLLYELTEPVITDISDLLTDNSIPVESGGTLTFVNEYKYAVPNDITYFTNNVERLAATEFVGTATRAILDGSGKDIAAQFAAITKIVLVNELPANPDPNTLYVIPE